MSAYPIVFCAKKEGDTGYLNIALRSQDEVMEEYSVETLRYSCRLLGNSRSWDERPIFIQVDPVLGEGEVTENLLWSSRIYKAHAIEEPPQWGIITGFGDAVFLPYDVTREVWGYYDSNEAISIYKVCDGPQGRQLMNTRNRQPFSLDDECYALEVRAQGAWTLILTKGVRKGIINEY